MVAIWNEAIETLEQSAFAAATGASNKHQFASRQSEGNIFDSRGLFKGLCAGCSFFSSWFGVIVGAGIAKTELIDIHCPWCIRARCVLRIYGHECMLPFALSYRVQKWVNCYD